MFGKQWGNVLNFHCVCGAIGVRYSISFAAMDITANSWYAKTISIMTNSMHHSG